MSCEICGEEIHGSGKKIRVEGTILVVCHRCAELGDPVREFSERKSWLSGKDKNSTHTPPKKSKKPRSAGKRMPSRKNESNLVIEIVDDYAKIVRKARGSKTLEEFAGELKERVSVIQKIESGKLKPTIQLATKIEKMHNVKLLEKKEEADDIDEHVYRPDMKKEFVPSLGDFLKDED